MPPYHAGVNEKQIDCEETGLRHADANECDVMIVYDRSIVCMLETMRALQACRRPATIKNTCYARCNAAAQPYATAATRARRGPRQQAGVWPVLVPPVGQSWPHILVVRGGKSPPPSGQHLAHQHRMHHHLNAPLQCAGAPSRRAAQTVGQQACFHKGLMPCQMRCRIGALAPSGRPSG